MPVSIKGKEYVTVAERVELLRQSGKTFEIVESMPVQVGERCVWRVAVLIDGCRFYGSAECHFNAKPGTADATDPFACGETSAIGRALGFAGFGAVDSIASADEIIRTEPKRTQPKPEDDHIPINAPTPRDLRKRHADIGMNDDWETVKRKVFKQDVIDDELTPEQCVTLNGILERFYQAQKKAS